MLQATPALLSQRREEKGPPAPLQQGIISSWGYDGRNPGSGHFVIPGQREKPRPIGCSSSTCAGQGGDHAPSQLCSLTLRPQTNCGFNCHCPCFTAWPWSPGMERLPARAGAGSGMKQPPPRASPRHTGERPASFQHWEALAQRRETQRPHTAVLARPAAHPEKLPGTSQQLRWSGASTGRASQPCSHKPPLSAPFTAMQPGTSAVPGQSAVRGRRVAFSSLGSPPRGWQGQGVLLSFHAL